MVTSTVLKTKFSLKYASPNGSYTYSNIKNDATDENILSTAKAFGDLQKFAVTSYYKIVEKELTNQ